MKNSPVINIVLGDEHIVETPKAKVRAKNIILAVNGHIQSFGFSKNDFCMFLPMHL